MTLSPSARKLTLTAHITSSVGWLGAIIGFLAIAIAGVTSVDHGFVRAAARTMETIGWFVLVPLAVASLLTGLLQGLGSAWGVFRHYWVVAKLAINLFATVVLLLYMQTLGTAADVAARPRLSAADLELLQSPSPVLHGALALALLVVATILAVYKPRGLTPYGRRHAAR